MVTVAEFFEARRREAIAKIQFIIPPDVDAFEIERDIEALAARMGEHFDYIAAIMADFVKWGFTWPEVRRFTGLQDGA